MAQEGRIVLNIKIKMMVVIGIIISVICGYQGEDLDIVNLNHDFKDNSINNLVPSVSSV